MEARSGTKIHIEMSFLFALVLSVSLVYAAKSQQCPAKYLRFSPEHSFCKAPNPQCPIFHKGVTDKEAAEIVDVHNQYRSKVATGNEKNAGGLPTASDMMQMVWDRELAAIAQKRAEQCIYAHDCSDCRSVENFSVGQNIAYRDMQCWGSTTCSNNPVPEWPSIIKMFYDEVSFFNKRNVKYMSFSPGVKVGHFTQMVWSRTWRVGCGFVAYKKGNGYRHLYVCNYGPSGNMIGDPLYLEGPLCSECPENSCCDKTCQKADYPGLCKMMNNNEAPIAPHEDIDYLSYCDFRTMKGDCTMEVIGAPKWNLKKALGGSHVEIVLNGGESSTLKMKKIISPKSNFCISIKYRTSPSISGQAYSSSASVVLERINSGTSTMRLPTSPRHQFYSYNLDIGWKFPTKISLTFSVPSGVPPQCFDIREISTKEGHCLRFL